MTWTHEQMLAEELLDTINAQRLRDGRPVLDRLGPRYLPRAEAKVKPFTGLCVYCGARSNGVACDDHADLPALEPR